jgi:hypothetical protein
MAKREKRRRDAIDERSTEKYAIEAWLFNPSGRRYSEA